MDDVALMYNALMEKVVLHQNGVISKSMNLRNQSKLLNYGVPVTKLDIIANTVLKNNQLADYCWLQNIREAKLLAIRIYDPGSLKVEMIEKLISGIETIEIAEQLAFKLFGNLPTGLRIAQQMLQSEDYLVNYCALMTVQRISGAISQISDKDFCEILKLFIEIKHLDKLEVRNGLSRVLIKIAKRNEDLKQKIINWTIDFKDKHKHIAYWMDKEVMYYLVTKN